MVITVYLKFQKKYLTFIVISRSVIHYWVKAVLLHVSYLINVRILQRGNLKLITWYFWCVKSVISKQFNFNVLRNFPTFIIQRRLFVTMNHYFIYLNYYIDYFFASRYRWSIIEVSSNSYYKNKNLILDVLRNVWSLSYTNLK